MSFWKYYDKIKRAQREPVSQGPGSTPDFNFDESHGFLASLFYGLVSATMRPALWFCRTFCPNPRLFRLVLVTRADDVREVLSNQTAFQVPFGLEMIELGGENTVLAMDDCPHAKLRCQIEHIMQPGDEERVRNDVAEVAKALIDNSGGRIDIVGDLIVRCATESCARYFGLEIDNPVAFGDWTMALSRMLFADPAGGKATRADALYASRRLQDVARRAVEAAHTGPPGGDTMAERFVAAQVAHPDLTDARICATLVGTTTGYIPTTALAAVKMLQVLFDRPEAWDQATDAARKGDRNRLTAILMEAGRLNPALFPGQWRYARAEAVIAKGTWRSRRVREGDVLMVASGSAVADGRQFRSPGAFNPKRDQQPELMFGHGPHYCLGDKLAKAMITEVLMALLALENLRPASDRHGKLRSAGAFPRQWDMEFTPPDGRPPRVQSMTVVCAPLLTDEARVRKLVTWLGNPARRRCQEALVGTGVIHFASLTVANLGEEGKSAPHLLLEINADGPPDVGLEAMAKAGRFWLEPIFARTQGADVMDLLSLLKHHSIASHAKPWSTTHLNYNGIEEFSVADIDRQHRLADFCQHAIDYYARALRGLGRGPMQTLRFVRKLIHGHPLIDQLIHSDPVKYAELITLREKAETFRTYAIQPARRRLKLADWVDITINQARVRTLFSKDALPMWIGLLVSALVLATGIFLATASRDVGIASRVVLAKAGGLDIEVLSRIVHASWADIASRAFLAFTAAVLGVMLLLGLAAAGGLRLLRLKELSDPHDIRRVDLEHLKACTANEDPPSHVHNHFVATPTLKRGLFRRLTLAAALWGIGTLIVYGFRPGFVLNMGTIHYAKWFRAPGTRRLVFFGNYDGSWESYLEDFITKAHLGQNAGWSNCEGFPPTKYLVGEGAQDGDRFKRWVRRQQIPTGFWFSRFPHLTTERIRNNALVHHGLTHANTDSAARAWLACFGSQQRPESMLETDDIQSIAFNGFGKLKHAVCAILTLPEKNPEACRKWLVELVGGLDPLTQTLATADIAVTFGDAPGGATRENATTVAFSAEGLRKMGLPEGDSKDGGDKDGDGLATFPGVFRMGMSNRSRTLGDDSLDAPERWSWADAATGATRGSDAVLMIYGVSRQGCQAVLQKHLNILGEQALLYRLQTQPARDNDLRQEHFGFRDAVSQPVIRGTERFVRGENPEDVLEPGEFILGYRSNQGYFPSTPVVHADTDSRRELATAQAESPKRFPIFAESPHGSAFHDFGRNGSYLVLRQFEQHVKTLDDFACRAAERLPNAYPELRDAIGGRIWDEWIKAKLVGRWPNGVSMLDRPHFPGETPQGDPGNSFAFGRDDPQGLRCPLGAHARRANPRDSLDPADKRGREITNRHRLLRRGRAYAIRNEQGQTERGLLFACLCSDLERQFEFVQQTWINSTTFHGLSGEADPLLRGHKTPSFTIPTPAGALRLNGLQRFVTVKGGGYYFLPSRSALAYLVTRSTGRPPGDVRMAELV